MGTMTNNTQVRRVASIGCNRALMEYLVAICILYHIIVAMKPMTHTLNEFNDNTSMKKVNNVSQSLHWVKLRWQPYLDSNQQSR